MSPFPIKSVPLKKGPILAQKRVDYNGVLVIFKEEIGRSQISPLNLIKILLESWPFLIQNGTLFHPFTDFNTGMLKLY